MTHILIVDDEPSIREVFQAVLEEEGYDANTAADFFEAKDFLTNHPCDVVLADIILPRKNGLALLQRVREIDEDIPVIMITGDPDVSTAAEAVRHGAYDYIAKPVTQEALLHAVKLAAEKKHLLDEKRRLEAENLAHQTELEKKVAERTADLAQRNQELAALIGIGRDVSATLDPDEVLRRVAQRAAQICGAHRCTILLLTEDREILTPAMSQFSDSHVDREMWLLFKDAGYPVPVDQIPEAQQIIREKRPLFIPDAAASSLLRHWIEPFDAKNILGVPIVSKGQVIGLMVLDHIETSQGFTAKQTDLAIAIASQAAVAIENARLHDEVQRRAIQLEAASQVARNATAILDVDQLLDETVRLISDQFDFYHAGIFLVDDPGDAPRAVLRAASSKGGRRMLEREHKLAVGKVGIVGYVTGTGEPRVVLDVGKDAVFFDNPDLPDTRSEMALPLVSRGRVIGALDVQSTREAAFGEDDVAILQTMADQLANAIENARLFEVEQHRVAQLATLNRIGRRVASILDQQELLQQAVDTVKEELGYLKAAVLLRDEKAEKLYVAAATDTFWEVIPDDYRQPVGQGMIGTAAQTGETLLVNDAASDPYAYRVGEWLSPSSLSVPMKIGERVIGVLEVEADEPYAFDENDRLGMETLADQIATAIENARLFEAEQRQRREADTLYRAAQALSTTLNLRQVLERILSELQQVVRYDSASVQLLRDGQLEIIGGHGFPNLDAILGLTFDLSQHHNPNANVIRQQAPFIVDDASAVYPKFGETPYDAAGARAWLGVPLVIGDRLIGMLALDKQEPGFYTQEHADLAEAFAAQAAIAIENARLYEEARRHVEELTVLHNIDVAITSTLSLDNVLQQIYEQISRVIDFDALHVALYDDERDRVHIPLIIDRGEKLSPLTLQIDEKNSLSSWVIRNQEPLWIGDAKQECLPTEAIALGVPTRSLMVLPLITRDKVVGVISAQSYEPHAFDERQRRRFSDIATQVAIAVDNAQLFEETSRRLAETSLLQQVTLAAASTLDFDLVLEQTVKALHRAFDIDRLGFLLPDEEKGTLMFHPPLTVPRAEPPPIPVEGNMAGRAYQTGRPVLRRDTAQKPLYTEDDIDIRSALAVPVRTGDRIAAVLYAESPTAEMFSEDDLRIFTTLAGQLGVMLENARLYRTLQEQKNELSQAYEELKELNRLRSEVVQNVSHELNTPLSLVQGYVELLLAEDLGMLQDDQLGALQVIRKRTGQLKRLIHNLTTLQSISHQPLNPAPIPIAEPIRQAIAAFRRPARQAGIRFHEELPAELPPVLGDQEQLTLVFKHLIDNAVKFSPDGGTVTIRAWAEEACVSVSVSDEGIGISPEHMDRIFERFYQVNGSARRRFGGMGVGLALVWEVVEAHGGTVKVRSEPEEGSTFTMTLPQA